MEDILQALMLSPDQFNLYPFSSFLDKTFAPVLHHENTHLYTMWCIMHRSVAVSYRTRGAAISEDVAAEIENTLIW